MTLPNTYSLEQIENSIKALTKRTKGLDKLIHETIFHAIAYVLSQEEQDWRLVTRVVDSVQMPQVQLALQKWTEHFFPVVWFTDEQGSRFKKAGTKEPNLDDAWETPYWVLIQPEVKPEFLVEDFFVNVEKALWAARARVKKSMEQAAGTYEYGEGESKIKFHMESQFEQGQTLLAKIDELREAVPELLAVNDVGNYVEAFAKATGNKAPKLHMDKIVEAPAGSEATGPLQQSVTAEEAATPTAA